MAAIAKYIVKRPFEYEGVTLKIGEELILDQREADPLFKKGMLTGEQFLDPDHPKDAEVIKTVKAKRDAKKAQNTAAYEARKETKDEVAAAKDDDLAAK